MRTRGVSILSLSLIVEIAAGAAAAPTVLGVRDTTFTLNGQTVFLLGMSYYGALGALQEFVQQDLDDLQRLGFNWLRVWATWESFGEDVSAVDARGHAREPYMSRLEWLLRECDKRGLIVDVTLTRGQGPGRLPDLPAHRAAVESTVSALREYRNWYIDLANERDVTDARFVSLDEVRQLRDLVRELDPQRLVTVSFGGHDLNEQYVREALITADLDFVAPHRPRFPGSPAQTRGKTSEVLTAMRRVGAIAPVHYQEPFRRGYAQWEPAAADFFTDLRGAVEGGAAGWCLHNGDERRKDDGQPRRSFDLRTQRLFEQLDEVELQVAAGVLAVVAKATPPR